MVTPTEKLVDSLGGPVGAARAINEHVPEGQKITYQAVQKWVRSGEVPPLRCIPAEQATKGEVTRYDLRPDIFGTPPAEQHEAA